MLSPLNWFQTLGLGGMAGALWFQLPRTEESLHGKFSNWHIFICRPESQSFCFIL